MGAPREIGFAGKWSGSRGYMKHCFSGFGPRGTGLWFLGRAGQSEAARSRPPTSHLSHFSSSGRSVAEGLVQNRGHRFGVRSVRRPRSAASARRGAARARPSSPFVCFSVCTEKQPSGAHRVVPWPRPGTGDRGRSCSHGRWGHVTHEAQPRLRPESQQAGPRGEPAGRPVP